MENHGYAAYHMIDHISYDRQPTRSLGFFVQCNGDSDSTTWSCIATAELRVIPQEEGIDPLTRKIQHIFYSKENDWGFSHFVAWNDIVDPEKGYLKDDSIILEVWVSANIPYGVRGAINEANLNMSIRALTEDSFAGHKGNDLFDVEEANCEIFKVKRQSTVKETLQQIAARMKYPVIGIRLWPITSRENGTMRPSSFDTGREQNHTISEVCENQSSWSVFLELIEHVSGMQFLPVISKDSVLLFFKVYDPRKRSIFYCCYAHVLRDATTSDIVSILNEKAGYPSGTPLHLYEEVKPNVVQEIEVNDQTLANAVGELMDGDIIVFQRTDLNLGPDCELPTVKDYFKYLYNRVEVTFCDKTILNDSGFIMELSLEMDYDQISHALAQRLGSDSSSILIFKSLHKTYRDGPSRMINSNYEGTLKDILLFCKPKQPKKLYYELL